MIYFEWKELPYLYFRKQLAIYLLLEAAGTGPGTVSRVFRLLLKAMLFALLAAVVEAEQAVLLIGDCSFKANVGNESITTSCTLDQVAALASRVSALEAKVQKQDLLEAKLDAVWSMVASPPTTPPVVPPLHPSPPPPPPPPPRPPPPCAWRLLNAGYRCEHVLQYMPVSLQGLKSSCQANAACKSIAYKFSSGSHFGYMCATRSRSAWSGFNQYVCS